MSIRRGPSPADDFAQIANAALRDERLSWKARGLLAYLMTHREGWRTSVARLQQKAPDGRDSVRAGLAELIALGYLTRTQQGHDEHGKFGEIDYDVTDLPPSSGFPSSAYPSSDNPTPKKTREKNTKGEEHDQQLPRGRATDEQVAYLMDLHAAGGAVATPEVEATFRAYSITQADTEIKAARRWMRAV